MPLQKAQVERAFQAIADPTRRAIVETLCRGPRSVSRLAAPLGITLTAVTQHIRVLEESGLVATTKMGRVRTCRIDAAGFRFLQEWLDHYRAMWERRLDRLGELLEEANEE